MSSQGETEKRREQRGPAALERLVLVQRSVEAVVGDRRHDRIDPLVVGGRDQLDAAAVRHADHAHPRIARPVEQDFGLVGEPADDGRHVTALEIGGVELQLTARIPLTTGIPRDDVVARITQRADTQQAEQIGGEGVEDGAVEGRRSG